MARGVANPSVVAANHARFRRQIKEACCKREAGAQGWAGAAPGLGGLGLKAPMAATRSPRSQAARRTAQGGLIGTGATDHVGL